MSHSGTCDICKKESVHVEKCGICGKSVCYHCAYIDASHPQNPVRCGGCKKAEGKTPNPTFVAPMPKFKEGDHVKGKISGRIWEITDCNFRNGKFYYSGNSEFNKSGEVSPTSSASLPEVNLTLLPRTPITNPVEEIHVRLTISPTKYCNCDNRVIIQRSFSVGFTPESEATYDYCTNCKKEFKS